MSHYPDPQGAGDFYPDPQSDPGFSAQQPPQGPAEVAPYGQTGGWQVPPDPAPVPTNAPLTTIGDITVTQSEIITPVGRLPVRGSGWTVTDMSHYFETTSTVGVVLAVGSVLVFGWVCGLGLLGLLFLFMKERRFTGHVQVAVQGNGVYHATMIPVRSHATVVHVTQQVNYARTLAAM